MRGLPPLQALVLLLALVAVGFAGSIYIGMGRQPAPPQPVAPAGESQTAHTVEAEVELVFSSPPLSYTLKALSNNGGEDKVLLRSPRTVENPGYGTIRLEAHSTGTYWLDVVWPADAAGNSHHFVQVTISPSYGEEGTFSFHCDTAEMNETFDYSTGSTGKDSHE